MIKNLSVKAIVACCVAVLADLLQVAVFPMFAEGALSPVNDALDVVVAAIMTALLGWHWVFLPSAAAELVPGLDLAPFWSGAVLWVVLGKGSQQNVNSAGMPILNIAQPNALPLPIKE